MQRRGQHVGILAGAHSRHGSLTDASAAHVPCRLCHQVFTAYKSLYRHLRTVHEHSAFACPDCGNEFARKDTLNRHRARKHRHDHAKPTETPPPSSSGESLLSTPSPDSIDLTLATIPRTTPHNVRECESENACDACLSVQSLLLADSSLVDLRQTGLGVRDPFLAALYMLTLLDPTIPSPGDDATKRVKVHLRDREAEIKWLTLKMAVVKLIRAQLQSREEVHNSASPCYAAILLALMENSREHGNLGEAKCHVLGAHEFMKARHRESCRCGDTDICEEWLSSDRPDVCATLESKLHAAYGIPKLKASLYQLCEATMRFGRGLPMLEVTRVGSRRRWGGRQSDAMMCAMRFDRMDTSSSMHMCFDEEIGGWGIMERLI